jgi:hypothetical protein
VAPNNQPAPTELNRPLPIGSVVEVRTRYLGEWSDGFQVTEYVDRGCRIGRTSDGCVFDDVFQWTEIRRSSSAQDAA